MTRDELIQIVTKASTLFERLGDGYVAADEPPDENIIQDLIDRWQERVAKGDEEQWYRRLQLDSLDPGQIRKALGPVRLADPSQLPAWALTLQEAIEIAANVPTDELRQRLQPPITERGGAPQASQPVRFEAFVLPFLEVACRKLRQLTGEQAMALLTEEAQAALRRQMADRLSGLCWQALQWEFAIFRSTRRSPIFYRFIKPDATPSTELYQDFVRRLLADGLAGFFQQSPVLARLMATWTQSWAEATAEFLRRVLDDLPCLPELFQHDATTPVGRVKSLRPGLSDPHNGCRTAAAVTFESGMKLVYKPRNLSLDKAWFAFLGWLNTQGLPLKLRVIGVLDRGTHGWVEFVPQEPIRDQAAARRYYQRVGMQIALLHVLEGTDFHRENIIACGDQPVLVDQEMILRHRLRERASGNMVAADREASELLSTSVLRSGLLPQWAIDRPGEAVDMSGLGSIEGSQMPEFPQLEHVNSDSMDVVSKRGIAEQNANDLIMDGIPQSASDYGDEIVEGFDQAYVFLTCHRDKLAAPDGPLAVFRGQSVRFVYRPTRLYGQLLECTLQARYLHDGVDRSIELDMLSGRFVLGNPEERQMFPLLRHEVAALERMDVPVFHARSNEDCVRLSDGQVIDDCFREASDARVLTRLNDLSEDDRQLQIKFIRGSLYSCAARHMDQVAATAPRNARVKNIQPLSREEAIAEALAIGEGLRNRAIVADDGSATWLGLEFVPGSERWVLQPLDRHLYGGTCGVALFLATLEKITGDGRFRDVTMGALASLQKMVRDPKAVQKLDDHLAIGGAVGLGSYVYSLVRIGQLLDEKDLLEDATRCVTLLTDALIKKDESLDIIAGAAGAILGMLALHDADGYHGAGDNLHALARAVACGQHLLDKRTASSSGPRAWKTISANDRLLTGFSHGAAGIACALLRLFQASGDEQYKQAAIEAMDYERAVFSAERGNWPDFRELGNDGQPHFMVAWCHGAPGIGLARVAGLAVIDTPQVRLEIETAIAVMMSITLGGRDHLCCGTLGCSDILLSLARRLARPELETRAQQQAAWTVRRARQHGYKLLDIDAADAFIPGMFQGLAGVGYALLRLAGSGELPSVLLWE